MQNNDLNNLNIPNEKYTIPINLSFHNLTIYGKTWYERHFNAIISDSEVSKQVQNSIKNLEVLVDNNTIFKRILKTIESSRNTTESIPLINLLNDVVELMHQSIQKNTWIHLFGDLFSSTGKISQKYGKSFACSLYYTLDAAINQLFNIPFECESLPMEISIKTVLTYPEIIELGINEYPTHKKSWGGAKKIQNVSSS